MTFFGTHFPDNPRHSAPQPVVNLHISERVLTLYLQDGARISIPLAWYPRIAATGIGCYGAFSARVPPE